MAWKPPEDELDKNLNQQWSPPKNELDWKPPEEELDNNPAKIKDVGTLQQMKESGQPLTREQERILWEADKAKPLTQKASEVLSTALPAGAKALGDLGIGTGELALKGLIAPLNNMFLGSLMYTPEQRQKILRDQELAYRAFAAGGVQGMEELFQTGVKAITFGTSFTDKLQGLSEDEQFNRYMLREYMSQEIEKAKQETPDALVKLAAESPLFQGAVTALAGLEGVDKQLAVEEYKKLMREQGLTEDQLKEFEKIAFVGDVAFPLSLPGANKLTKFLSKPVVKGVQKTGELALKGIKPIAELVEGGADLTLKGTELIQGGAKKLGEYTVNDPDTWFKTTANTIVTPVNLGAKPTRSVARVVKDVTSQVDVGGAAGRRGLFERAGRAETSSDLTRRLFGPQGKGGVARAKVADWTVRQANAIIQPGVNAAALNVLMGLPEIETATDLGSTIGTGFGIGGFAGARVFDRAGAIIDPTTSLAEKITTVVTPDMAQRRLDEDADIKRFLATATPEMQAQMADLSNIDKRKTAIDSKLINLRQQKERTINAADEANLQRQIDGFEKQRQALEKATPETVREAERQVQLAFMDAMDLAQATGTSAGLRGLNLTVLNADNAEGFFRNLYGGAVERAEGVVNLLTGRTDLTMQESQNLQQARELLDRYRTEVAGAKNQRGFAIGVDGTDPNADGYVPPHLRKVNQTGATAVINGDLVKHLSEQGFDVRRVINHEMQHALQQFREVKDMLSPIRGDLFDQKVVKDDGTVEVWKQGIFSDADIARYGANYAAKMSPADNGASFIAQFQDVDAFNAYIKDEILAEVASQTGDYSNGTRAALDDVGRNLVDWLEVKTKAGALRKMKEGLRTFGIVFDNYGGYSNVLGADLPPQALAMIRQYQRQLRDFDGSMQIQTTREEDAPDIPMTAILGSRALQEKYKDADFFEKEQILRSTAPDGTVTEIVMPKGAKLDPFVDIYRIQGGQLVDANGNPVQLPPEITFGSLPEGSTFQMDTRIARKPDGSPITLSAREIKSRALERTQSIRNVIDSAPDDGTPNRLIDTGNGNYRGVMSPSQLAAVLSIPNNVLAPALKRQIQFFNELMQRGDGTRAIFEYQAALLNGKYKAIAPKIRDEVPIGWQFTKDGNFALTTISVSRLYDKLQAWADQGTVTQEQTWTGELIPVKRSKNLALWNGDTNKFWNSLVQVLDNHANGREGWVGLHSDELTAKRMRNKVNDLFNVFNKETKEMNPDRSTLPRVRGRDNVDIIVRSRRVDRINSFSESPSTKVPVNYGKLLINYMPETNPLAAPQTPEQFMENINGSVSATRIRNAIATGAVDQLEAELRNSDDLLPTESLFVSQGEGGDPLIQVTSMLDPNVEGALEPEEVVVDLDARTAAELSRLEAEEAAAMAAQQQAPVEPAPAPEPAPEPAPAPTTQFMPVEAPSGERGFQSKLQLEIQKKFKGASATPEQLKAVLGNPQNVKPEEVKWSGVMDEIDRLAQENNGKVPVQELMNYLRNEGQVKFNEVTLGGVSKLRTQDEIDQLERQAQRTGRWDEYEQAVLEFEDQQLGSNANQTGNLTIHAKYQLPGGKNYREVVLSMPSDLSRSQAKIDAINKRRKEIIDTAKEQDLFNRSQTDPEAKALNDSLTAEFVELGKQADQLNADIRDGKTGEQFTSSHFPDVPNYIAHMRVNERTDADGNPGLFVEEFQSDRHQQGREKGYVGEREMPEGYELIDENQSAREAGYDVPSDAPPRWRFKSSDTFSRIYNSRQEAIDAAWKNDSYSGESRIPDAPFRKDWGVQLFKRALRDAVESGKSWIGWTTGETQAERYDLSKQVEEISVYQSKDRKGQFFISVRPKGSTDIGMQEVANGIPYDKIQDYLGKELAAQINPDEFGQQNFSGLDLKVGGEGMKGFYDQILPKEIGKYVSKMGGKVEKGSLETEKPRQGAGAELTIGEIANFAGITAGEYLRLDPAKQRQLEQKATDSFKFTEQTPIWRVNITPEMENVVRAGQIQFMPAESDADYLRLAQDPEANREQLQRMVDEAARSAGYNVGPLYHGTDNAFSVFRTIGRQSTSRTGTPIDAIGAYFSDKKEFAQQFGKNVFSVYAKIENPYQQPAWSPTNTPQTFAEARLLRRNFINDGYDALVTDDGPGGREFTIFNPEQIKSADPVTYDDAGNVIPLSQRFQTTSPDIRFMPEEQGPLADIQAPEQKGEKVVLEGIQIPVEKPKEITPEQSAFISEKALRKFDSLGDKNATQVNADNMRYPVNSNPDSVALPGRWGLVSAKITGMPKTFKEVSEIIDRQVNRLVRLVNANPEFAKESARFYRDMAESATMITDAAFPQAQGKEKYLFDELVLRFLALGSPRTSVAANASKSAGSVAALVDEFEAGYKIGFGEQSHGAKTTFNAWKKGGHFDLSLPGVQDKVRSFYLNSLAELIEMAEAKNDSASVEELMVRAGKSMRVLDPNHSSKLTDNERKEIQRLLDGKATIDMWDMAAKGWAWPGYIIFKKRRNSAKQPFQWSQDDFEKTGTLADKNWKQVQSELGIESPSDLRYQQARALKIDGNQDWTLETWNERKVQAFPESTKFSYYTQGTEAGLSPGGGGPLYDAQQAIDGLLADRLNELGLATLFGKTKLKARNAQEILWALEKLDNPIEANNDLSLFGNTFEPFLTEVLKLRQGKDIDPKSRAENVLAAMDRAYAAMAQQLIPIEVVSGGTSEEAKRIQDAIKNLQDAGDPNAATTLTLHVADGLGKAINDLAIKHGIKATIENVDVGEGGYTENQQVNVAPNIRVTLRGKPEETFLVLETLSRAMDQDGGNVIRKPTMRELNDIRVKKNLILTIPTTGLDQAQRNKMFLDLAALKDANGDSFLTGFTEVDGGIAIGNQFYSGDYEKAIIDNKTNIDGILKNYGLSLNQSAPVTSAIIQTFYRGQASTKIEPEKIMVKKKEVLRPSFASDLYDYIKNRMTNIPLAGSRPSFAQRTDFEKNWIDKANALFSKLNAYPINSKSEKEKAKLEAPDIASNTKRTAALVALKSELETALLRDQISEDVANRLKAQYGFKEEKQSKEEE